MGLVNALLVRWRDGYHEVVDAASIAAHGRHGGFLSLGNAQSVEEVERVTAALFALQAQPKVATTVTLEPTGVGDEPYRDFTVADYVTAPDEKGGSGSVRVRALTVTEDDHGNPIFVPEVRSIVEEDEDRFDRWLRRFSSGALGGSVETASPAPAPTSTSAPSQAPAAGLLEFPPAVYGGALFVSVTPKYRPPRAMRATLVQATLVAAGTTPTVVRIYKNGAGVHDLTLAVGATLQEDAVTIDYTTADEYQVGVVTPGAGARGLDVSTRAA